jgi:hypothetical protein
MLSDVVIVVCSGIDSVDDIVDAKICVLSISVGELHADEE